MNVSYKPQKISPKSQVVQFAVLFCCPLVLLLGFCSCLNGSGLKYLSLCLKWLATFVIHGPFGIKKTRRSYMFYDTTAICRTFISSPWCSPYLQSLEIQMNRKLGRKRAR